jgi:GTPase SAR1 family protein
MAHIKTVHKAAIISTDLSVKNIKKLEAINPDALEIKNDKGETLFKVATGSEEFISKYGIVFANDSKISVIVNTKEKLDRETVSEIFGATLLQLSRVEEQANAALESIGADLDSLIEIEDESTDEVVEPRRRNRR